MRKSLRLALSGGLVVYKSPVLVLMWTLVLDKMPNLLPAFWASNVIIFVYIKYFDKKKGLDLSSEVTPMPVAISKYIF